MGFWSARAVKSEAELISSELNRSFSTPRLRNDRHKHLLCLRGSRWPRQPMLLPAELSLRSGHCRPAAPWGSHARCYFPRCAIYQHRFTGDALLVTCRKEKCGHSNFRHNSTALLQELSRPRQRCNNLCLEMQPQNRPKF